MLLILNRIHLGQEHWVSSNVLVYEIQQTPASERRRRVFSLLRFHHSVTEAGAEDSTRAEELQAMGFKAMDSLHMVCAEKTNCAVLLTTDDRLLRVARRNAAQLGVQVMSPVDWWREELIA